MGAYSCSLCQLAFDKGLGNIVPLSPCLILEHVLKRDDHIVRILILKLLLEFRFHACKHKTTNLKRIITCSLVGILEGSSCIISKFIGDWGIHNRFLFIVPENNSQVTDPVRIVCSI